MLTASTKGPSAAFEEFWRYYLSKHASEGNRALHAIGTVVALGLVGAAIVRRRPLFLLLAPVAGYGPAWLGHFLIEGNRPATLDKPLWSLRAELKMLALMACGRMGGELQRLGIDRQHQAQQESFDVASTSPLVPE